jgi:transcriptional regulator with XRE-family HTH domain
MFSQRLKKLRNERQLFQKDLADFLGITTSAYGFYEQGKRQPDQDTLNKLADYFNVSTDYLLGRSNTPRQLPDPGDIIAAHMTNDDDKKGLPPEAIEEIREHIEFIRYKYRKKQPDDTKKNLP